MARRHPAIRESVELFKERLDSEEIEDVGQVREIVQEILDHSGLTSSDHDDLYEALMDVARDRFPELEEEAEEEDEEDEDDPRARLDDLDDDDDEDEDDYGGYDDDYDDE
ncbi:MAG: hypothetical protein AB1898_21125 [Acidobacteriota bacterium]